MNKINNDNRIDLLNFKSKYYVISLKINELVGGKENYEKVYNCITRVRFKIKDKSKVKIDELKKINLGYYEKEEAGFDVKKLKNKINIFIYYEWYSCSCIAYFNSIRITIINSICFGTV